MRGASCYQLVGRGRDLGHASEVPFEGTRDGHRSDGEAHLARLPLRIQGASCFPARARIARTAMLEAARPGVVPTLRPASESDLGRIVELWRQLAQHDIALGQRRPLRWAAEPTAVIVNALGSPSDHHMTVAVDDDGQVVGTCHTALMGEEHPCAAHIHDLIVDEPYRGHGLGRALLDDAMSWCDERGVDEVCLGVAPLSSRSRQFYELYGFEEASLLLVRSVSPPAD